VVRPSDRVQSQVNKKGAFGLGFSCRRGHSIIVLAAVSDAHCGQKNDDAIADTAMVPQSGRAEKSRRSSRPLWTSQLEGIPTRRRANGHSHEHSAQSICKSTSTQGLYTERASRAASGRAYVPSSDQVFMESVVSERPEVLSGPSLVYPICCVRRETYRDGCWCKRSSIRRGAPSPRR